MLKEYPKTYEDIYPRRDEDSRVLHISSTYGSADVLAEKWREFSFDAHRKIFEIALKQIWLEQHFVFNGQRRNKRKCNGQQHDWAYGYFQKFMVGITHKPVAYNQAFSSIITYFKDLFPDFLKHDPFEEPEYFAYPFKTATIDYLTFVHLMPEIRMDILKKVEEEKLSFVDFANWVTNYVFCYNDEVGEGVYVLSSLRGQYPYIKNTKLKLSWTKDFYEFDPPEHLKNFEVATYERPHQGGFKRVPEEYQKNTNTMSRRYHRIKPTK